MNEKVLHSPASSVAEPDEGVKVVGPAILQPWPGGNPANPHSYRCWEPEKLQMVIDEVPVLWLGQIIVVFGT